jgi:hypothetical protein
LHLHLRVDRPDSRCTLVLEGGDEGASEERQHVFVAQGLDQSLEGPKANHAIRQAPDHLPYLLKLCNYPCYDCVFKFQELN